MRGSEFEDSQDEEIDIFDVKVKFISFQQSSLSLGILGGSDNALMLIISSQDM